jgi:hypothetical protein
VPFYQWGDWIDAYLNKSMINKEYNKQALAKIFMIENARQEDDERHRLIGPINFIANYFKE